MLGCLRVLHRETAFYVVVIIGCSAAFEKHWLPDLEWQTASNWADNRVPDIDSRVIFPQQTRHAVGIGPANDLRLSGIDLPRQGSLVLPRNGKLQVRTIYKAISKVWNIVARINRIVRRTEYRVGIFIAPGSLRVDKFAPTLASRSVNWSQPAYENP